jgi:hypothetical protein
MTNDDRDRTTDALTFRAGPDAVYNRVGDQGVLIDMKTNRIYELNRTGARFWELLSAGHDRDEIQQLMMEEFDVTEADLAAEIEAMLASLKDKGLLTETK